MMGGAISMAARLYAPTNVFSFFTVVAVLVVVLDVVWSGTPCFPPDYFGDEVTLEHRLPSGSFRCCKQIRCPKGTYTMPCEEDDPFSTSCKECPAGTFMDIDRESSDMYKCEPHNTCSQRGLFTRTPGTIISDAVCGCVIEQGYNEPIGVKNPTYCMGPKACPAGEELSLDHSCKPCEPYMFKPSSNFERCHYWTHCETQGLKEVKPGSSTTDSVCEVMVSTEEVSSASPVTTDHHDGSTSRSNDTSIIVTSISVILLVFVISITIGILIKFKCIPISKLRKCWNKKTGTDIEQSSSHTGSSDHSGTERNDMSPGPSDNLLQQTGPTQADPPSQTPADPGAPLLSDCVNTEEIEVDGPDSDVEEEQNLVNDHTENARTPPSVSPPMQTAELQQQGSPSAGSSEGNVTNVFNTTYNITGPSTINHQPTTNQIESATGCLIGNTGNGKVANNASEERDSEHDETDSTVPSEIGVQYTVESDSES